jgi:hypothetical protein
MLGAAGVGLGCITHDPPLAVATAALSSASSPNAVPTPPSPSDPIRANLQRQLEESGRQLERKTRELAECQRDAKAALDACRDEGRQAIEFLTKSHRRELRGDRVDVCVQ